MLKNILSASPMAISYVQGAKLRWTNQAMVQMFRYEHEGEYLGKYAQHFYASHDEYNRIRAIFIQRVGEGKPVETEALFRRKDGTVFYGHLRISPLDHSNPAAGIISTIADISEKKEAERRLLESEERYRELYEESKKREELYSTLLNSSADAVVVYDMEGRTRYVNDSFTRIFGWTMEEVKNRHIPYLPDSERQRAMEIIEEIIRDGIFWSGFESKRYTKDGRVLDVRLSASRYHDHEGNPSGMLVTLADITEQKRLEEKLRQAAKMEAIGRLAGGVAHDFNNLLTAIIGYAEMLLHEIPQNAKYRHKVLQISNAAERTADLTRQLLAFSRKQILDVTVVNLNTVIGDLENLLRRLIGEDVELVTSCDFSLGCTKADRSQIEQILVNLVVNARDAMPKGGTLTIETANAELGDEYVRKYPDVTPGPYVLFAVSDTGHGMEANVLSRIFDPFFTTKEKGLGTGLGLSTVYGIVKQHQGHVAVYSEPGRGTTFKVYLPRADELSTQQSQAPDAHTLPRGNEVILLVEDEEIVRKLACDVLEMLGYCPLEASNPDEAIAACLKHEGPIHLMLTDVVLPRMDGRSLYNLLSSTKPEMKVLYMSGYTENAVVDHGVLDRGVHFLQKPFNTDSLALKVREVLDEG
jgi:PAS domain S-box-containing protein